MLTFNIITHDRLRNEEEERKRRERETTDLVRGAMSNILTLVGTGQVDTMMRQVKDEMGLVVLDKGYQAINSQYPMTKDTFADFLTEYTEPGHLDRIFQTALTDGTIETEEFAQKTAKRFDSLSAIAAHSHDPQVRLDNEVYWNLMSGADQGQDAFTTRKTLVGIQPGGARTAEEERLMASNTPEEYQQNLQAGNVFRRLSTSVIPEPTLKAVRGAKIGPVPVGKVIEPPFAMATAPGTALMAALGVPLAPLATGTVGAGVAAGTAQAAGLPEDVVKAAGLAGAVVGGLGPGVLKSQLDVAGAAAKGMQRLTEPAPRELGYFPGASAIELGEFLQAGGMEVPARPSLVRPTEARPGVQAISAEQRARVGVGPTTEPYTPPLGEVAPSAGPSKAIAWEDLTPNEQVFVKRNGHLPDTLNGYRLAGAGEVAEARPATPEAAPPLAPETATGAVSEVALPGGGRMTSDVVVGPGGRMTGGITIEGGTRVEPAAPVATAAAEARPSVAATTNEAAPRFDTWEGTVNDIRTRLQEGRGVSNGKLAELDDLERWLSGQKGREVDIYEVHTLRMAADATGPPPPVVTTTELPGIGGGGGTTYAGELLPFGDVLAEVAKSTSATGRAAGVIRWVIAKTGINPALLQNTPLGRVLTTYERQMIAADQLTEAGIQAALDSHAQRWTGRTPFLSLDRQQRVRNVTSRPGAKYADTHWRNVFSRPGDYEMVPELRAYIADYLRLVDDAEAMRVQAGLPSLRTRAAEDGWFYVPGKVQSAHGIETSRPSNPHLQRVYDDAAIARDKSGTVYWDPRTSLETHLRQAYREIIEAQLSEAVEPLSVTTKQLMPTPVLQRMSDATTRRIAAERAVRKAGKAATPEMRAEEVAAKAQWRTARSAYTAARKSAEKAQWAKGKLFGQQEDYIPIVKWRNRFLPRADYEQLNNALLQIAGRGPSPNFIGRGFQVLGNTIRFLASVGDFAEPFVQGLLVFGKDPVVWARATLRHYQAFFDPTVQARLVKDHLRTFQEMARHGTPVGDPEFFAALRVGEGIPALGLLGKVPGGTAMRDFLRQGGRQTFGRFQTQYNVGLGYSRALLTEAMKTSWKGTMADLQASIRLLTGGLDSRALGVGPTQRGVESMWLAFAPRLLRSTAALVADLRYGPMNPRGRVAYESLGKLAMGATGIYIATGLVLRKSWEEIETGLNPLNGKKFMAHEINGDWIGIGGQVRAITQLMATSAVDAYSVTKGKRPKLTQMSMDNPLFQFYSSRGAVGMTTAGGAAELATGLNVMPYENIDSFGDLAKQLGTSALPFTIQGQLEGESLWTWPFSFGGLRVSAGTTWEATQKARDAEAQARGFKGWDDPKLDDPTKYQIDQGSTVAPLLQQLEKEGENRPQTPQSQYYAQVDTLRAAQQAEQNKDDDFYNSGKITVRQWQDRTSGRNNDIWVAMQQAQKDFGITFKEAEATNPVDAAIAAYYAVDAEQYKDETGEVAWDQFNAAREAALAPLSTVERGQVEDYIHKFWTDEQWEMYRKEQRLQPYFDIPEETYQRLKAQGEKGGIYARLVEPTYDDFKKRVIADGTEKAISKGKSPQEAPAYALLPDVTRVVAPEYKPLQDAISRDKETWRSRRENRALAALLIELGYNPASRESYRRGQQEPLVLPLPSGQLTGGR